MNSKKRVLVTGGTGLIGKKLIATLEKDNYECYILTRNEKLASSEKYSYWDCKKGIIDIELLKKIDHIVHLSGANIIEKKWTKKRRKEIISSRVQTANFLFDSLKSINKNLKTFISASAIGYYGYSTSNRVLEETDPYGSDFTAECCYEWEKSAEKFIQLKTRVVKLRLGVVVGKETQFSKINSLFRNFRLLIGFGDGKQAFSWIHLDDVCNVFKESLHNHNLDGSYNLVSNELLSFNDFLDSIKLNNSNYLKFYVHDFVLSILLGKRSKLLTKGSLINNKRLHEDLNYKLKYNYIKDALMA